MFLITETVTVADQMCAENLAVPMEERNKERIKVEILSKKTKYVKIHYSKKFKTYIFLSSAQYWVKSTNHTAKHHKYTLSLTPPSLQNEAANVAAQQHSRKLLKMDILMLERC